MNTTQSKEKSEKTRENSGLQEVDGAKTILEGNGFKVLKSIGVGSYSKVKLAFSETHKTVVAIKIVSKYKVPAEFLRKFLYNEINVVRRLGHENIIKYYQSIESSHRLYVVMQFAENGSLLDLIHEEKYLSESVAHGLFIQMVAAIRYIHLQGVVHRDLKCENILLDKDNKVKLIDFGFAKAMFNPKESTNNSRYQNKEAALSETYCGSYAYASPEILRGTPYNPIMSDIWALGVVLFAMVFGRLPFDDRDVRQLLKQVESSIKFPSSPVVSKECKDLLKKILSPIRNRATIDDILADPWIVSHTIVETEIKDNMMVDTNQPEKDLENAIIT